MALPAMAAVRARWPGAHITVGAVPAVAPILHELTGVRPAAVAELDPAREPEVVRAGSFDLALLLTNSFRTALIARRARVPERWGYAGSLRGPLLSRAIARPGRIHQVEYYLHLVEALGVAVAGERTPRLGISDRTAARADALLQEVGVASDCPLVGVAPGAAYGHAKRWPPARMAQLVDRLTRDAGATTVLVGAAADREAGRAIESALLPGARVVNLIGRTGLRVFAGVVARCRAFVSNDSGAMHVAAAAAVPVTAIFGPTDERVTAPAGPPGRHDVLRRDVFCRRCMLRECPIDHRCMTRITVDEVYASVARRLEAPR
jgi:heptosyltransferase-2